MRCHVKCVAVVHSRNCQTLAKDIAVDFDGTDVQPFSGLTSDGEADTITMQRIWAPRVCCGSIENKTGNAKVGTSESAVSACCLLFNPSYDARRLHLKTFPRVRRYQRCRAGFSTQANSFYRPTSRTGSGRASRRSVCASFLVSTVRIYLGNYRRVARSSN